MKRWAVIAALALGACSEGTSILIEVRSAELVSPDDVDGLYIEVVGADSGAMLEETFALTTGFPHTYRVYPRAEHNDEAVTITVRALRSGGVIRERITASEFIPGTHRTVVVDLDGTPLDGGVDGMVGDAGCMSDSQCDDEIDCTDDVCDMGGCTHSPDDSACAEGEVCHPTRGCGEACASDSDCQDGVLCNGSEMCVERRCFSGSMECDDGIDCTVDSCVEEFGCTNETDDARCDDGDSCDGDETCVAGTGCVDGTPLACNDAVDCTDDGCAASACTATTRDADDDGHGDVMCPEAGGVAADDCDDTDPAIFPGAPDICNGVDDDCDGTLDNGQMCGAGEVGECDTTCGSTGSRTCNGACRWGTCIPPVESCNGADDDCNGENDEDFECVQDTMLPCMTACGTTGVQTCSPTCTLGVCEPPAEICEDGIDQDCEGGDALCRPCPGGTDAECDDGDLCNGVETCFRFTCAPGTPVVCNDMIACTDNSCDPATGGCVFTANDANCLSDGNFCNGPELCRPSAPGRDENGCVHEGTPSCDDSDACTDDSCSGTMPGMCVGNTRDNDRDRHGDAMCAATGTIPADDCNDAEPSVFPGAPEDCNGVDDDCDGTCDDGFACCRAALGTCTTSCGTTGNRVCSTVCSWGVCVPPVETCNGVDDDCNSACDDAFACCRGSSGMCISSCGSLGSRTCGTSCAWGTCSAPAETCSGVDDDCDGNIDEGFTCRAGAGGSCTTSCGSTGSRTCTGSCAWGTCNPPPEMCNGTDDDCDGNIDEGFTCAVGANRTCTTGCSTTGSQTCTAACNWGACNPPTEVCNGTDDDCDTFVDDGFTCAAGSSGSCSTSCMTTGTRTCSASCAWGTCNPPAEVCNGADDDCDTMCDDGFTCCRGASGSCTTSCGSTGSRLCGTSCAWGVCMPPPEICNGVDDDCDSMQDEGFTCRAGSTGSCTTSCMSTGSRVCSASCAWGACTPPVEVCNGVDDDCDSMQDEGFTCRAGSTGTCPTSCGTTGSRTCSGTCAWGACVPPAEACNGIDDDCDMMIDETVQCVSGSMGSCTTSCGSTGNRTCSAMCTWGTCNPPAEVCNGLDDDCDALVDDGFTCQAGSTGACTASCGSTGSRMCSGTCTWGSCTPPAEVCNGLDDDCDAMVDDGFTCAQGATGSCTASCGSTGSRTCQPGCSWGTCNPPAEVCNGADDDCDTLIDDGFTCAVGSMSSCLSSCGTTGSRVCNASCAWGSCTPPAEVCNGTDDDCDGLEDETFACDQGSTGSCTTSCGSTGSRVCSATCAWGSCTPPAEVCNGLDDDCDMMRDETFTCQQGSTGSCMTSCGSTGSRTCGASCTWGACVPPAEVCNGVDDDCDGFEDEGFTCDAGSSGTCTTSCGSTGSRTCSATCMWGTCNPPAEVCNGADDDCDMMIDDGFTCVPGATSSCTSSCGTTGSRTCTASCTWGTCNPPAEVCNGMDDDCDTIPDDGFTCSVGQTGSCTSGCGTTGSRTCSASCTWGACNAPAEICNGADDDCVMGCDNGFTCCQGSIGSCTTGCGSSGTRSCSGTCTWGSCVPPAESCNGLDDDCVMGCDNGFTCCVGANQSCTTSCGSTGSQTCSSSCAWGTCNPPTEICNGADDDCAMGCDNGFTCCAFSSEACTTSCGSTGSRTCSAACGWGMCNPPVENCGNTVDDDCDGNGDAADSDCAGVCPGSTTIAAPGGRYTATLVPHSHTGTCGGAGAEAYFNFTLTATSDVFLATHGTIPVINTVLYVRSGTCAGTQVGCNTDADGLTTSRLSLNDLPAGQYQVFVDTVSGVSSGTITLDAYITPTGTAGDRCGDPTFLTAGTTSIAGTTCGYSDDERIMFITGTCNYVTDGNDRIYYFYLPTSRTVTFVSCGGTTNFDTVALVRSVCTDEAAASSVACDDDSCSGSPGCASPGYRATLTTTLGPGLYYFLADGYVDTCGCGNYTFTTTGL